MGSFNLRSGLGGFASGMASGIQTGMEIKRFKKEQADWKREEEDRKAYQELIKAIPGKGDLANPQGPQAIPADPSGQYLGTLPGTDPLTSLDQLETQAKTRISDRDLRGEFLAETSKLRLTAFGLQAFEAQNRATPEAQARGLNVAMKTLGLPQFSGGFYVNEKGELAHNMGIKGADGKPINAQTLVAYAGMMLSDPATANQWLVEQKLRADDAYREETLAWAQLGVAADKMQILRDELGLKREELEMMKPYLAAKGLSELIAAGGVSSRAANAGKNLGWDEGDILSINREVPDLLAATAAGEMGATEGQLEFIRENPAAIADLSSAYVDIMLMSPPGEVNQGDAWSLALSLVTGEAAGGQDIVLGEMKDGTPAVEWKGKIIPVPDAMRAKVEPLVEDYRAERDRQEREAALVVTDEEDRTDKKGAAQKRMQGLDSLSRQRVVVAAQEQGIPVVTDPRTGQPSDIDWDNITVTDAVKLSRLTNTGSVTGGTSAIPVPR